MSKADDLRPRILPWSLSVLLLAATSSSPAATGPSKSFGRLLKQQVRSSCARAPWLNSLRSRLPFLGAQAQLLLWRTAGLYYVHL